MEASQLVVYPVYPVLEALLVYDKINSLLYSNENILISCPDKEHEDERPSCSVNVLSGLWYCHGCDKSGNYKSLIRALEEDRINREIDEWELECAMAAIDVGSDLEDSNTTAVITERIKKKSKREERSLFLSQEFFHFLPKADWSVIQYHYMQRRKFNVITLQHFDIRINYSSAWSIIIPIMQQGVFMGYVARQPREVGKKETKYLNNPGLVKTEVVFADLEPGPVLIVEGPLDLMKAWQYGFHNVACIFGWHISEIQAAFIRKYATAILCGLDGDEKGRKGYARLREVFADLPVQRFFFPEGVKDICEMDEQMFALNVHMPNIIESMFEEQALVAAS